MSKEEGRQTMWETWFVISLVLILVALVTGLMEYSKIDFPNWPYFVGIVVINFLFCIKIGIHTPKK